MIKLREIPRLEERKKNWNHHFLRLFGRLAFKLLGNGCIRKWFIITFDDPNEPSSFVMNPLSKCENHFAQRDLWPDKTIDIWPFAHTNFHHPFKGGGEGSAFTESISHKFSKRNHHTALNTKELKTPPFHLQACHSHNIHDISVMLGIYINFLNNSDICPFKSWWW